MLNDEKYRVELSTDAGLTWSLLAKDLTGRSYVWKPAATLTQGNGYRIRVMTDRGHVSSSASFTLNLSPAITAQPSDVSACAEAPLELSVGADGTNLKYQWRKNGTNISGATAPTYRIAAVNASSAGRYDVVVTGACNPSATSRAATVSVATSTVITTQPVGVTVEQSRPFTLSVVAAGSSLTYQWMKDGTPVTGATSPEYKITSSALTDAGSYTCEVTGGCGTVMSAAVVVTVTPSTSVDEEELTATTWLRVVGPTPASEVVVVNIRSGSASPAIARVIDGQGRVVGSLVLGLLSLSGSDVRIPVSGLANGIYSLEVVSESAVGRVHFLVVK